MMEEKILVCENTFTGILTGIYEAYAWKLDHAHTRIQTGEGGNLRLFSEYCNVIPEEGKAIKVIKTLKERLGSEVYTSLSQALASEDEEKGNAVYHTVVEGLGGKGRRVLEFSQNDHVRKVFELSRNVWGEIHHLYGFLRFEELESGLMYSKIGPKNNIITFLATHFSDRFQSMNFIIYDEKRNIFAVHPARQEWFLVRGDGENENYANPKYSEREIEIQMLFKHFCTSIAIEERRNPNLQRNLLPLRFREYMTEFK